MRAFAVLIWHFGLGREFSSGGTMKISIVTDEISNDVDTAFELGKDWGIEYFELRGMNGKRVPDLSDAEIGTLLDRKEYYGAKIAALSPGLFKIPLDRDLIRLHMEERLPQTFRLAERFGTKLILVFGIIKPTENEDVEGYPAQVVEVLSEAAGKASEAGITLLLENEHICWADTGARTARIVREVGSDHLRVNWDPCNAYVAGEQKPFPNGYECVRDLVNHLHIKDTRKRDGGFEQTIVGEGDLLWKEQLQALGRDSFDGFYTIETHFGPRVKRSRQCVQALRKMMSG